MLFMGDSTTNSKIVLFWGLVLCTQNQKVIGGFVLFCKCVLKKGLEMGQIYDKTFARRHMQS